MKRKVKFQEGGTVEEPSPRRRQLRTMMEKRLREGKRVGLAERARQREAARQEAERRERADRARARAEVERLNPGQGAAEAERRAGRAVPERAPDFSTDERGTTRRGAATGREVVPAREQVPATRSMGPPPAASTPSMQRAMTEVMPRQMPLGRVRPPVGGNLAALAATTGAALAEPVMNYARGFMERRGSEADARREANLQAFRSREQAEPADGPAAGSMQSARPAAAPARRPAPAPRRELTMEEIRALRSGARAPRTSEERALQEGLRDLPQPRQRMSEADMLNERELRRRRAEREAAEQMGGSGNIGAASARERGEQVGPFGDYNLKKGGIVKKKAGGMVKAAPKKMMKGGMVAKPKATASKAKPKSKPVPAFKKGGIIKKGKK